MVSVKDKQSEKKLTTSTKRRIRRNRLKSTKPKTTTLETVENPTTEIINEEKPTINSTGTGEEHGKNILSSNIEKIESNMSSKDNKSKEDVLAARQAKKQAKQKGKPKNEAQLEQKPEAVAVANMNAQTTLKDKAVEKDMKIDSSKGKDEVDRASVKQISIGDSDNREQVKAERAAKKAAKQAKKKGEENIEVSEKKAEVNEALKEVSSKVNEHMTVRDVVETLRDIVNVAKEMKDVTEKVSAIDLGGKKPEESGRSKAELKAERRAKQEAQRAAKQVAQEQKVAAKPKTEAKVPPAAEDVKFKEEKVAKPKVEKLKVKSQSTNRVNWFQHLYKEHEKDPLKNVPINSNLHPAIIKLGVQLASRVVTGSNARCIALLDALKKMVRDYTLPAKTEFARGLEAHLATSLDFLWSMRAPSASQTNAVKCFRYHLTRMPNNIDEFDAKKKLQEEIDRYIREQIDMAGEAISIAVRNKISNGDNILTYGCSSLIERILRDAWSSGLKFRTVVVGSRVTDAGAHMLRRLVASGLPCTYVDTTALGHVMKTINKVILGAGALLVNGSVLGAAGTAQVALAARACNVPVLVACETHKVSERVQTDAVVYNEIGDPDDLIDKSDDNSPLKDWRSNPNLTPLNLTYDVTPASLVTAVVTELAILPCTSAPVVLRFKLSEYSV